MATLAKHYKFRLDQPFAKLPKAAQKVILYGSGEDEIKFSYVAEKGEYHWRSSFEGLVPMIERRYRETENPEHRAELEVYMSAEPCPACRGRRLKPEALAVLVGGRSIDAVASETIGEAIAFFEKLKLSPREREIAGKILKEIQDRLRFLANVGIGYLNLSRGAASLSGGESQRIRLATQIGSKLMGVLYVLDEPSIGLHQRDNRKLIDTLVSMRDLGQHGHRGRARRGDDPLGGLGHRPGARRGPARRPDRRRGRARGPGSVSGVADVQVLERRTRDSRSPSAAARGPASPSWCAARASTTSRTWTCAFPWA